MGKIVYAAAMSHVLAPDYYGKNVGPHGRKMVEELIDVVRDMGRTMLAAQPDALVVIADDHLNVFSFDAVPAMCVRIGRSRRMPSSSTAPSTACPSATRCTRISPTASSSAASRTGSTLPPRGRRRSITPS